MYISDSFIDKYMGHVQPIYLLSYIYIVRKGKKLFEFQETCNDLGIEPKTLHKILKFWKEQGVLTFIWKEESKKVIVNRIATKQAFDESTYSETKKLLEDPEFKEVVELSKSVFPNLSVSDTSKLAGVWKDYEYRKDIFVVLLKYSQDHNARHPSYMFTIAQKWHDVGVKTAAAALAWIDGKWGKFCVWKKLFGTGVDPTDTELEQFRKWDEAYTDEQVVEAINITILKTGKAPLKYIDAVLRNKYNP